MSSPGDAARAHGFHRLRVARVERETDDAVSLVLAVPDDLRATFAYRAGQFCTFRAEVAGATLLRCYSMASAPEVDPELKVTVKAVPDGRVSGFLNREVRAGDELEVTPPAGVFCLADDAADGAADAGDLLLFAAGSGITPVISLLKSALATTDRRVRLLYANRDAASTIFRAELDDLVADAGDRLVVEHHLDEQDGFVGPDAVARTVAGAVDGEAFVCGPTPFMDLVEAALLAEGVDAARIHIERFTPSDDDPVNSTPEDGGDGSADASGEGIEITIEIDGRTGTTTHHPGTTVLQAARALGLDPPYSCEAGSCATCMGRLHGGAVRMHVNDALSDDEVAEGWILTCQSVPTEGPVRVVYGFD